MAGLGFVWIPIVVAAAVSAGGTGSSLWIGANRLKNNQKLAASNFANEAETYLAENVNAWLSIPQEQRTPELRAEAISIFYYWWRQLEEKCATMGAAGARCINERKRGGVNSWGADWFELYLDPIEQSAVVQPGSGGGGSGAGSGGSGGGNGAVVNPPINLNAGIGGVNPMLLLAGIGVAYLLVRK